MSPDTVQRRWAAVTAQRERLLRIARARTLNEQDAEDCVQEAMLRCVEFADLDEARLEAFLTTVTVRLCADTHRVRKQRDRVGPKLAGPLTDPGPEEDVCDRAEAAWVADRFSSLPARQQEVVSARAEGMSYADTARRFGMTAAAVESMLSRARRTLRAAHAATYGWLLLQCRRLGLVQDSGGGVVTAAVIVTAAVAISIPAVLPGVPGRGGPVASFSSGSGESPAVALVAAGTPVPTPAPALTEPPRLGGPTPSGSDQPKPLVSVRTSDNYEDTRDPVTWAHDCVVYGWEPPGPPWSLQCKPSPESAPE